MNTITSTSGPSPAAYTSAAPPPVPTPPPAAPTPAVREVEAPAGWINETDKSLSTPCCMEDKSGDNSETGSSLKFSAHQTSNAKVDAYRQIAKTDASENHPKMDTRRVEDKTIEQKPKVHHVTAAMRREAFLLVKESMTERVETAPEIDGSDKPIVLEHEASKAFYEANERPVAPIPEARQTEEAALLHQKSPIDLSRPTTSQSADTGKDTTLPKQRVIADKAPLVQAKKSDGWHHLEKVSKVPPKKVEIDFSEQIGGNTQTEKAARLAESAFLSIETPSESAAATAQDEAITRKLRTEQMMAAVKAAGNNDTKSDQAFKAELRQNIEKFIDEVADKKALVREVVAEMKARGNQSTGPPISEGVVTELTVVDTVKENASSLGLTGQDILDQFMAAQAANASITDAVSSDNQLTSLL